MPTRDTTKVKQLSRRLLALESMAAGSAGVESPAAFRVCDRMRQPLSRQLGAEGFRMLLARALTLAQQEGTALAGVKVRADGMLELATVEALQAARITANGERLLIAQLLGLLLTFVGPSLTLRWVHDLWPAANDLDL